MEQVANFATHPHSHFIRKALHFIGYRLVWQRTLNLLDQSKTARNRWLALAVRIHAEMPIQPCQSWPIATPDTKHPIDMHLPQSYKRALHPTPEALATASDPQMYKVGRQTGMTKAQVLAARTITTDGCFPTVMATYGSQHLLDLNLLRNNGFLGFFIHDDEMPSKSRYLHPAECALLHGVVGRCFHDPDLATAWRHQGNCIAVQHALVPIVAAINRLLNMQLSTQEVFQHFHEIKLKPSDCHVVKFAHGYMLCHKKTLFTTTFQTNADLWERHIKGEIAMKFWSPLKGMLDTFPKFADQDDFMGPTSPISVASSQETWVDTLPFQPVLQACIKFDTHVETIWCAADHQSSTLEAIWDHSMAPTFHAEGSPFAFTMQPSSVGKVTREEDAIVVLMDGELTLMKSDPHKSMLGQQHISSLATMLFDQFGPVATGQTPDDDLLIMPQELMPGSLQYPIVLVAATFAQVKVTWHWSPRNNVLSAYFEGPDLQVETLANEWKTAIDATSLATLGRQAFWYSAKKILRWEPARSAGVCPPRQFRLALAVHMTRKLLNGCGQGQTDLSPSILLKWWGRPLWTGMLPNDHTLAPVFMILQHALTPVSGEIPHRLMSRGQRLQPDFAISQLEVSQHRQQILIHAVLALRGGGQGSKTQQKAIQQSALASALLEQGHDLAWTTRAVDSVVEKTSLQKLQTITSLPMGNQRVQAIYQLCKDNGVKIQDVPKPATGKQFPSAPWNQNKRRKEPGNAIDPAEFQILSGFFMNEDGTNVQQLASILPQATGICLQTPAQAEAWISEAQTISCDELGLLVLGTLPVTTTLKTKPVTFPCLNAAKQKVLLHGQLVQLGNKLITCKKDDLHSITEQPCQLVALTMYKSDFNDTDWAMITGNPIAHAKKVFTAEGVDQAIHAYWGKSLRCNRLPASPAQATSVQLHCTVEEPRLHKLLSRSGFNKVFATPKTQGGQIATQYKVIWYPGDVTKLTTASTKTIGCLGLVKGKQDKGYGLRFMDDKFEEAWQVLHPGVPTPTLQPGDKLFKIQGLPFGCTHQMMMDWSDHLKWKLTPVRALGPQTWLARSPDHPPEGIVLFNSQPLLIRYLPPKEQRPNQVLLGPRTKPAPPDTKAPWGPMNDPWANYTPNSVPASASQTLRSVDGPTEKRLASQDDRINALADSLKKLEVEQQAHAQHVSKQFEDIAMREQDSLTKIQATMHSLQTTMEHNLQQTMSQHTCKIDAQFGELKQLFMQRSKRRSPEAGDDSME